MDNRADVEIEIHSSLSEPQMVYSKIDGFIAFSDNNQGIFKD